MCRLAAKIIFVLSGYFLSFLCPALAHVKWFLSKSESELLAQPKPSLFTHLSTENIFPLCLALALTLIIYKLNFKFVNLLGNRRLTGFASKNEAVVNLLMALGLGASLIYCGFTHTLLVPNFIICSHCPQWLAPLEIICGICLTIGLFSRFNGMILLGLMYMAIRKHGLVECLDIMPLVGLAFYFMLCGRNKYSLDNIWKLDKLSLPDLKTVGHYCVRSTMGLGLIALAFSEKLLHPQLAMDLLQHAPALNPFLHFGMSNDLFVLITGLAELILGVTILFGWLPRIAVLVLLAIFCGTTAIFGMEEFIGHAACYSSILSIALWGAVEPVPSFARSVLAWLTNKVNLARLVFVHP